MFSWAKRRWVHVTVGVALAVAAVAAFVTWVIATEGTGFTGKTLREWFDLLLVPVVLGVGAVLVNWAVQRRQSDIAQRESEADREIAENRTNEETLRHYQPEPS